MDHDPTSIYGVLDLARDRPGMYGIIGGRSFRDLQIFLAGMSFGRLDDGEPPFRDFADWMLVRTGNGGKAKPLRWLETSLSDEEAYATWFRLLDEYRRCRTAELARLPGSLVRHLPGGMRAKIGGRSEPYEPPLPTAIRLGQFAPSSVFFVEQILADGTEKLIDGFGPTLDAAIDAARRYWQVDPDAWGLDRPSVG